VRWDADDDPDEWPRRKKAKPAHLIRDDGTGELEYLQAPETPTLILEQQWYGQPWRISDEHVLDGWEWHTFDTDNGSEWRRTVQMVEDELDLDLLRLVRESPSMAVEAIRNAANQHKTEQGRISKTRDCAVCDEDLHIVLDSYTEINHKVVCDSHPVQTLKDHDLV
jgi:hypothetical protein